MIAGDIIADRNKSVLSTGKGLVGSGIDTATGSVSNLAKAGNQPDIDPEVIKTLKDELKLSNAEIANEIKLFSTFDDDSSGYLSAEELVARTQRTPRQNLIVQRWL